MAQVRVTILQPLRLPAAPGRGLRAWVKSWPAEAWIGIFAVVLAAAATAWVFSQGNLLAYGDAESHVNIPKRVLHSLTPGAAQLGGIWLPLSHILMLPFVYFDELWRTGLAGSIVSGAAYAAAGVYLYKLARLITKSRLAGIAAALVFLTNPNILYLQATPMTELPLIAFFVISTYYFVRFLFQPGKFVYLVLAGVFGLAATLTRYDGWLLVLFQALALLLLFFPIRKVSWTKAQGYLVLFGTLAFAGIVGWMAWDFLILGDPLYFTTSEFSAKSQQQSWMVRGELPAHNDLGLSFQYYSVTSIASAGLILSLLALLALLLFAFDRRIKHRFLILLLLSVPFVFYVATLYMGQSVIFIPQLTPSHFEWTLFNVRYGTMMIPFAALLAGYLIYRAQRLPVRALVAAALAVQVALFAGGQYPVLAYDDGVVGLSSSKNKVPDAENFFRKEYDHGLVLLDDFARTISIVRSGVHMRNIIYVGNKPYWEESLREPEKYARWIIMQEHDQLWTGILEDPAQEARLYKYFIKVYTSPDILIFQRNDVPAEG